jgi:hypothetical protein
MPDTKTTPQYEMERASLTAQRKAGEAQAIALGTDTPDFAAAYFTPPELAEVKQLGFWGFSKDGEQWADIVPISVTAPLRSLPQDHEYRPLIEKLEVGLERVHTERRFSEATDLGEALFATEREQSQFLPLDEAIARVQGFCQATPSRYLSILGIELMSMLVTRPGEFLPHSPLQIQDGAELAASLWGNSKVAVKDQVDLVTKLTHLHQFAEQLARVHRGLSGDAAPAVSALRADLVASVGYLDGVHALSEADLDAALTLPELRAEGCPVTIAEQLQRISALERTRPDLSAFIALRAEALERSTDVSAQQALLARVTLHIDSSAAEQIRLTASNPLRDRAFRDALEREPHYRDIIHRLEVGGMLFGRIDSDHAVHIEKVVPYQHLKVGVISGVPYLRIDFARERKQIDSMERRGYSFLGDWHLHPEGTAPFPSIAGDGTMHRALLGERFQEGRITVQLIAKRDGEGGTARIFPYAYHPFAENREVRAQGFSQALYLLGSELGSAPALIEVKEITEKPSTLIDRAKFAVWKWLSSRS